MMFCVWTRALFGEVLRAVNQSSARLLALTSWFVLAALSSATEPAARFNFRADTLSFANETVFAYHVDPAGTLQIGRREKPPAYAHRCFVMSRAAVQFHEFARFAPALPPCDRAEYARRVRQISRIPVWSSGRRERVVIPGYRDLRAFSAAHPVILQENLGAWLPTYLRVGNYRMAMGHLRAGQAAAARWLAKSVGEGKPRIIYLARFPKMNHCVVVYAVERRSDGDLRFLAYDPNDPSAPVRLEYLAHERSFAFPRRWYFPGGRVNVMRVYISPLH